MIEVIWSVFLDAFFADNLIEVERSLELLRIASPKERAWVRELISDGEAAMKEENCKQIYIDARGVISTELSEEECRKELETLIEHVKGAIDG